MKKIEAIIREEKLEPVKSLLEALGYHGMTVTEVSGRGRQKVPLKWGSKEFRLDFLPKLKIEVVVMDEDVSPAVNAIVRGAEPVKWATAKSSLFPLRMRSVCAPAIPAPALFSPKLI
jgi:nitrogen regulatory protein P-II 1